jgi:MraZ protein
MEFLGQLPARLDDKGRVTIPVKYRPEFGDDPVYLMVKDGERCISMYTRQSFANTRAEINVHSRLTPEGREEWRRLFGNVEPAVPDSQGRFVVPQRLLDKAGLTKPSDLLLVGAYEWLEIWDAARFREREA